MHEKYVGSQEIGCFSLQSFEISNYYKKQRITFFFQTWSCWAGGWTFKPDGSSNFRKLEKQHLKMQRLILIFFY